MDYVLKGSIMRKKFRIMTILSTLLIFMTACSGETMIKMSEENQKIVEEKQAKIGQNKQTDKKKSDTIDKSTWKVATKKVKYQLKDYIHFPVNEMKVYTDGKQKKRTYTTFYDEETSYAQIVSINDQSYENILIRWDDQAIYQYQTKDSLPFMNLSHMMTKISDPVLTKDIQKEKQWRNGKAMAKVNEIYQEIKLNKETYQDVIEVVIGKKSYYFAKDIGLIAENDGTTFWYLTDILKNVMLVSQTEIDVPDPNQNTLLHTKTQEFHWQTNDSLANALTYVFRENQWLSSEQIVEDIVIEDGIAKVTFSKTVVAQFNQHPQGEQAVIAAIISNVCQFTGAEQVKLMTLDSQLIPWTYYVPNNGIYKVDEQWKTTFGPKMLENN